MSKYGTRTKTCCIRLLTFLFACFLFAQEEEFAEINYASGILFLDSPFFIEIRLNDSSSEYHVFANKPELKIEENNLQLEHSEIISAYGGLIIKNKYKINNIGKFEITPYIISKQNKKKLKTFSIRVEPPKLSVNTKFRWKIFSDKNIIADKVFQGKSYSLILEGFFYSEKHEKNYESDINYKTPENSILENISLEDLNIKTEEEMGWVKISAFAWTPLKSGWQKLPASVIYTDIKNKNNESINIAEEDIFVNKAVKSNQNKTYEEITAEHILKKALEIQTKKDTEKINRKKTNFDDRKKIAEKIFDLRNKESNSIFSNTAKNKRIELEASLGFDKTFQIYPSALKKITAAIFFFFILLTATIFTKKKNAKNIIFIFLFTALCSLGCSIYLFIDGKNLRAVYIPSNEKDNNFIYHIPEFSGTVAGEIYIGETVLILRNSGTWFYIQKKDGTGGWLNQEDFFIVGNP